MVSDTDTDGLSFSPSMNVRMIKDQLNEFLAQEVEPLEEEYDQFLGETAERHLVDDDGFLVDEFLDLRDEIQRRSVEAGLYTMCMPEEYGGGGLTLLEYSQVLEELYDRHPHGFHSMINDIRSISTGVIPLYQDENLREWYFEPLMTSEKNMCFGLTEPDHGSDPTHLDTTAEPDGDEWIINGTKCFISNSPYADFIMVFARTSGEDGEVDGISSFIVDKDNPDWEIGKIQWPMSGDHQEIGHQAFNHFNDCRVPETRMVGAEGQGFRTAMEWISGPRVYLAAEAVGACQWMFDQCVDYAETRKTFGEPIGTRQSIKNKLADMRADIEQVRWLYRYTAWKLDHDERARWEQSAVKLRGSQLYFDVADQALQIHGGAGYMRSLPFQGELRYARGTRIYDGTDEIQKRIIANEFLDL